MASQSSHPPPGVPDGGVWGEVKYAGDSTNLLCLVLCLVGGIFTGCGTCAYLCPRDKKDAYQLGDSVYDTRGQVVGKSKKVDFRPFAPGPSASTSQPSAPINVSKKATVHADGTKTSTVTTVHADGTKTSTSTVTRTK